MPAKIEFSLAGFKEWLTAKAEADHNGKYDYDDIEDCAIGQYVKFCLGPFHDRYFLRVGSGGIIYLRGLRPQDESYNVNYPPVLDKLVKRNTQWGALLADLEEHEDVVV